MGHETLDAYVDALVDLPADAVSDAVATLTVGTLYMPTIADLRKTATATMRADRQRTEPKALDPGDYSRAVGQAWMPHIRAGLAEVGNGGVEPSQRKHTSDRWEDCEACRETARQVAVEVGE